MIRVYLDWNIFSYLKAFKDSKEPYKSLNSHLIKNLDKILIPYSSAHLTDLIPSYNHSERGKRETKIDLKYLEELTGNHCILYDYKKQSTYPDKFSVHEYFEQLLESETLTQGSFSDLFSSFKGTEQESLINSFLEILKKTPSGFDKESVNKIPDKFKPLKDAFQGDNMLDSLNGILSLMFQYNTNPKTYRSVRNSSLEELRMSYDYSNDIDPIRQISSNLERSAFKKTFKEFSDQMLSYYFKDKSPSRFDIFTNQYMLLDFLGYYRDKEFKNLVQDSFHAYYGAHCDFFITDDDNTYHKAKVLYEHFNIETIVCKSHEFNSEFYGKVILNTNRKESVLDVIAGAINSSFVITGQHDDKFNPADVYKIDSYILNYFNRIQVTHDIQYGGNSIYLYKKNTNYSTFYFFKEIETIVNLLSGEFGFDENKRMNYSQETENKELMEGKWPGRQWQFNSRSRIELEMREAPFGITLSIHILSSNDDHIKV